jgi:hypothetical protein
MADDDRQPLVLRRIPARYAASVSRQAAMSEFEAWVIPAVFGLDVGASDVVVEDFVIGLPPESVPGWEYPGSTDATEFDLEVIEAELTLRLADDDASRANMWLVHLSMARVRRDLRQDLQLHGNVECLRLDVETLLTALERTTQQIHAKARAAAFPARPHARQ